MTFITNGNAHAEAIAAELRQNLGVDIALETMDFTQYFDRLADDPPGMWIVDWVADYPGRTAILRLLLGSDQQNNFGRWSSAAFDAALDEGSAATDPAAAASAFDRAEAIVRDEAPVVPLSYGTSYWLAAGRAPRRRRERSRVRPVRRPLVGRSMSRPRRPGPRPALRVALAIAAAVALSTAAAGPILAAGTEWGTPSASSQYGAQVGFSQPATLPADTTRVEMLLTVPGTAGPFVTEVVPDALGSPITLRYAYDAAASHVYPNTRFEARWRVTRADGSVDVGPAACRDVRGHDARLADEDRGRRAGALVRGRRPASRSGCSPSARKGSTKASEFLGVTESAPVDFFIYASRDDFMAAFGSGSQEWAGAFALPETRTLIAHIPPDEFDTPAGGHLRPA